MGGPVMVAGMVLHAGAVYPDRTDVAERAAWAAHGRVGGLPLRCVVTDELLRQAACQGWPLLRVFDVTGDLLGAGPGVRTLMEADRTSPVPWDVYSGRTFRTAPWTGGGGGGGVRPDDVGVAVACCFEVASYDVLLGGQLRLDLPDGSSRLRPDQTGYSGVGQRVVVSFPGPFRKGAFLDDRGA